MEQFAKPQPNRTDLAITRSTTCQCTVLLSLNSEQTARPVSVNTSVVIVLQNTSVGEHLAF